MSSKLFSRLQATGRVPTPPGVVIRILELSRQPDCSARDIAMAISLDVALSAKILRFINSPMAGVARQVNSLQQAVALMGSRGVKMMALSFSVLNNLRKTPCAGFDPERFAMESLGCGIAAKILAGLMDDAAAQEAFSAGLLSQFGRGVLANSLPNEYAKILVKAGRVPADLPPLEIAALGASYAAVGEQVLRSWGIPETLCQAVGMFREKENDPQAPLMSRLLTVGETMVAAICSRESKDGADTRAFLESAHRLLALTQDQCVQALRDTAAEVEAARAVLELPSAKLRSPEEIEVEVRERIAELGLALHLESQAMALQQEDLLRRATTDPLTGIGNRAAFDARMALELERAARAGTPVSLLMIDVDHFKKLNDTYGHQAGDRVLQAVARALDENLRKVDYVARYGGEEFAVVAPGAKEDGAMLLGERLRQSVEGLAVNWEGYALRVTASVGAAVAKDVVGGDDGGKLIKLADSQLYAAKAAGRNRVSIAGGPKAPRMAGVS